MRNTKTLFVAVLGAALVCMSSLYGALKMGALPWPTMFAALSAYGVLRVMGNDSIQDANCAQAAMSAGGLTAGGVAFTLPALWLLQPDALPSEFQLICVVLSGALLGWFFTRLYREELIEKQALPFPMGAAAAEGLKSSATGNNAAIMFSALGVAAVFVLLRDAARWFVSAWTMTIHNAVVGVWLSPMALGVGYVIGVRYALWWLLGTIGGLTTFLVWPEIAATMIKSSAGIGMIIGGGIGAAIMSFRGGIRTKGMSISRLQWLVLIVAMAAAVAGGLNIWQALLMLAAVVVVARVAAQLTGMTAINPLELLGMMAALFVGLFFAGWHQILMVAVAAAVACALSGDMLQDLKSGALLGTPWSKQINYGLIGAVVGALCAGPIVLFMHHHFGAFGPGTQFAAPQSVMVATVLKGALHYPVFFAAMIIGALLMLVRVPSMIIGIGIYLPAPISLTIVTGGIIRWIVSRISREYERKAENIAAGFLGGEGIAGMLVVLWSAL